MGTTLQCQICSNGSLQKKKMRRFSSPLVIIGFIFLVPSICMFLLALLLVLAAIIGAPKKNDDINADVRAKLEQANIPDPLIQKFMNHKTITYREQKKLTKQQRKIWHDTKGKQLSGQLVNGAAVGIVGFLSVFLLIISIVGGLIGFIFTMKKKVLQCSACEAVVSAS